MKKRILLFTALCFIITVFAVRFGEVRAAGEPFITVEVKQGDSLIGIAHKYLKDPSKYKEIMKFNNIQNADMIRIGSKLKIPTRLLKNPPKKKAPATTTVKKTPATTTTAPPKKTTGIQPTHNASTPPSNNSQPTGQGQLWGDEPDEEPSSVPQNQNPPPKPSPVTLASAAPSQPTTPPPPQVASVTPARPEAIGTVFYVMKDVVRTNSAGADDNLKVGSVLKPGDRIVTDTQSFCSVSLGAGRVVVGPDTRILFEQIGQTGGQGGLLLYIKVLQGSVRIDAPDTFDTRIRSEVAVIRAKGAQFTFRVEEEGRTFVEIYSGKLDLTSAASRNSVTAGKGAVVEASGEIEGPFNLPVTPTMTRQEVNSEGQKHIGATWKQPSGAVSYRVEVAADAYFEKPVYFAGYAGESIDFNFLSNYAAGKYYIRLISVNQRGVWSAPSNTLNYTSQPK